MKKRKRKKKRIIYQRSERNIKRTRNNGEE